MIKPFNLSFSLILLSLTLSACGNAPVTIPDVVACGWIGPVGGANDACSCVHTNSTSIAPVHHNLNDCLNLLTGSVFFQGADISTLLAGRDQLCTETGSCTYQQAQAAAAAKHAIIQIRKIIPRRSSP